MAEKWTILGVLEWTARRFAKEGIDSPRLEAQILLAHALECDRVGLYTSFDKPLSDHELAGYRALIRQRLAGTPVAYLTGSKEFWSRPFNVDPRVLIPRADSEVLIETVLEHVRSAEEIDVLDVGTGSGVLAITLAAEIPHAKVVAIDSSADALAVAADNAARHGVDSRVELCHGDLFEPVGERTFDVVVANLPYVTEDELRDAAPEVKKEPSNALVAGRDGLDCYRAFASDVSRHLKSGGLVVAEHGHTQGEALRDLFTAAGLEAIETRQDLGGRDRLTMATRG